MKKILLAILIMVMTGAPANAQVGAIDSLRQLLQSEKEDTGKVSLLNNLSQLYERFQPDTALIFAQEALTLAKDIHFIKGEIASLFTMGIVFTHIGNYPKALQYDLESLNKAESIHDERGVVRALRGIYVNYSERGDERQAVNYAIQTLAITKRLHDDRSVALDMLNLSDGYLILNMKDSAIWYNIQGYNMALQQQRNTILIGIAFQNFGNIYSKSGDNNKALNYYRSGLPYYKLTRDDESLCETYLGISKIFNRTGNRDSSLYYAKQCLGVAQEASFTKYIMNASDFLKDYYASVHNIDSAYFYQSAAIAAKDSLFTQEKAKEVQTLSLNEVMHQQQIEKEKIKFRNQVKLDILFAGIFCLLVTALFLYRNNRHKQKTNASLSLQKQKVEDALQKLKSAQAQLIHSEKMASLGVLTAGIAHEIQNPLNFVNNFSEVNKELLTELKEEIEKGNVDEAKAIAADVISNEEKISQHGKRADGIVKGMLQHSRSSTGQKELTDINALCDEYLRLAYHGLRAKDKSFNAEFKTDFDNRIKKINIVPQDIGRVILNLINNAFYAVSEKNKSHEQSPVSYEPLVKVSTRKLNSPSGAGGIEIAVADNGNGIPDSIKEKIFQPFFTTKPTGSGTGLGLSLSYDIVKAHGGEIKVDSKEGEGTTFMIQLPS